MTPKDFVLLLTDAAGGSIKGRTLLQKRAYFVSLMTGRYDELGFTAHYYGPYSPLIDNSIEQLKSLGFMQESTIGFGTGNEGFEIKRYDYRLTEDGRKVTALYKVQHPNVYGEIERAVSALQSAGDPNYFELAIAAKAFFILNSKNKPMSREEIVREALSFEWQIPPPSLEKAISFLERVGFTRNADASPISGN